MLDWIVGTEAFVATGAAMAAVRHAEASGARTRKMRGHVALWRAAATILAIRLEAEREANLFATHLHRPRSAADQETPTPG